MHALLFTLMAASPVVEPPVTSLLVLPLEPRLGVSRELAETLTESVIHQLRRIPHFKVSSMREVESAMGQEQRRQLAGCDNAGCAVEIGAALNVDEIVMGTLAKVDVELVVNISRVVTRTGQSKGSAMRRFPENAPSVALDGLPAMVSEMTGVRLPPSPRAPGAKAIPVTTASLVAPLKRRIAVLYFDNTGKNAELEPLRKGLADMLITDLSQLGGVSIVEREKLEALLQELKLQQSVSFDAATAQKLGKLLGAEFILAGSFFDLMGQFIVDTRLIRVETGENVVARGVRGKKEDFMALENELAMRLAEGLEVPLTPADRQQIMAADGGTFADAAAYGKVLQVYDTGDRTTARKSLEPLAARLPLFRPAQLLMASLTGPPR